MSDHDYIRDLMEQMDGLCQEMAYDGVTLDADHVQTVLNKSLADLVKAGHIRDGHAVTVHSFEKLEERVQHRILWKWMELQHLGVYEAQVPLPLPDHLATFMGPDDRWLTALRMISPNGIIPAEDDEDAYEVLVDPGHPSLRYLVDTKITPRFPLNYISVMLELGDEE
jgi:hypothetical protein